MPEASYLGEVRELGLTWQQQSVNEDAEGAKRLDSSSTQARTSSSAFQVRPNVYLYQEGIRVHGPKSITRNADSFLLGSPVGCLPFHLSSTCQTDWTHEKKPASRLSAEGDISFSPLRLGRLIQSASQSAWPSPPLWVL